MSVSNLLFALLTGETSNLSFNLGTRMLYIFMLLNVRCNHSWSTVSWRRNVSKEIKKKSYCSKKSSFVPFTSLLKKKIIKKEIILVHFRNVKEEFRSRNQMATSHNPRQYLALSHAHSRTDGPEVTVIYTGQNLKSNTFRHGLNISL